MAQLSPYLNYNRTAREAMNFYKNIFGGKLEITNVKDMPAMAAQMPESFKDSVLHSTLVADGISFMASDMMRGAPNEGNTFCLCLTCKTEDELKTLFEKLSDGGKVIEAPKLMPWGDFFAEVTDKFGKEWIFDCPMNK